MEPPSSSLCPCALENSADALALPASLRDPRLARPLRIATPGPWSTDAGSSGASRLDVQPRVVLDRSDGSLDAEGAVARCAGAVRSYGGAAVQRTGEAGKQQEGARREESVIQAVNRMASNTTLAVGTCTTCHKKLSFLPSELWRNNALMIGNSILVASMVVIGATGWRYRHSMAARFISLGATTLFLPIVSYVVSSIGSGYWKADCQEDRYVFLLLMWTVLVQTIGTNFSGTVAANDGDSQKLGPSIELLARTLWTSYLVVYYYSNNTFSDYYIEPFLSASIFALSVLSFVKITLRFFAFEKARRSFALGRNTRLVVAGSMEPQLHSRQSEDEPVPPLIVMGEEKQLIEERPHGYVIINRAVTNGSLVTTDRVWRLASTGDVLLASQPQLKELCLSFALFKLLRRRFVKCRIPEFGSTRAFSFLRDVLLGDSDPDRVFRVVADEVSFLGDSYYSSLPACYFGKLLPVLNITVSLSIVTFCLASGIAIGASFFGDAGDYQRYCRPLSCSYGNLPEQGYVRFGSLNFNYYPTLFLLISSILSEGWDVASYICSNWLKVALICSYVTHASWQQSPRVHRCLGLLLKLRIKWVKSCSDQMGQVSLLALAHGQPKPWGLSQKLFCFSDHRRVQHVKVSREVKAAIVEALASSNGSLSNGVVALQNSGIGSTVLWAIQGESTSDVILIWHIATSIVDSRHAASTGSSADRTVATCISQYCLYLMKTAPELLPDDKAWSKKRYRAVGEELRRRLLSARCRRRWVSYDQMIELLGESSDQDEVVRNGVRLGKQLVGLQDGGAVPVWGVLARFWSEMICYAAPSDNLKAHRKAIARGGELLTLIWALLTNAGVITRPGIRTAAA
ncbi:hypothetical protein C2845_PM13G13100 [Panicum miliaceum]|uniref:DUF4220 domain-containing protein n=1 Tax=Panicum miliaceum TaxID=4540 RepID=A0A3L6RJG2_PANMI|nr:hypothetical protein C2845_PM13G13100 [Panicum miliaceum]